MSNFTQRIITGTILVSLIVACVMWNFYSFSILFFIFCLIGLVEFYTIASEKQKKFQYIPAILAGATIYVLIALTASGMIANKWRDLIVPVVAYFFFYELYNRNPDRPFERIAIDLLGLVYVVLPFSLLNFMAFMPNKVYNYEIVLACFIFLWCSDSGAYLVGRTIGKRQTRLLKRVSPKKTVEGTVGGVVIAALVGHFVVSKYFHSLSSFDWIVIAALVAICGFYGDLVESMLKRSFDIKDSGKILPGHGGILDRFDSLILAAPVVYAYVSLTQP